MHAHAAASVSSTRPSVPTRRIVVPQRALGGHRAIDALPALHRAPVEGTAGHHVDEGAEEDDAEREHLDEAVVPRNVAIDCERVDEDHLDVEHHEQHGDDVEA